VRYVAVVPRPRTCGIITTLLLARPAACVGGRGGGPTRPPPDACTFANPIVAGADPWVVRQGSTYYYLQSQGGSIWVYRSRTLTDLGVSGVRVWTAPDTGWNRSNVWAPELHYLDGRWYIYYAAGRSGPPYTSQRAGVLEAVSGDPQGAYIDKGMLYTGDDPALGDGGVWAIDLTVERLGSQLYAVWSGWERNADTDKTPQQLYAARMANPWTVAEPRTRISSPTESWEKGPELDLEEGPEFLLHGADAFIIYSTRDSWLKEYELGQLRLRPGADPLNPQSWVKSGPVFQGAGDVYGVGHASFTTSPDSSESWIVYHSKTSPTPGWGDRVVRMQKFTLRADGSPDFSTPVPSGRLTPMPSGQCP
jgi:GH43 family beta-xylosidase